MQQSKQQHRSLGLQHALLKDDQLVILASEHNIAQFVSFGPGHLPELRHCKIRGITGPFADAEHAVKRLLEIAPSCNIRTFHSYPARSTPFHYQLTGLDEVMALLKAYARQGYYTIVNETIDVNDGGVSGVALGGLLEFAPQDTPRAVEKPGIMSVGYDLGIQILRSIYGFSLDIPDGISQRVEFSIHPLRVGYKRTHTLLWQLDDVQPEVLKTNLRWPNRFSRFIGDKAFGLLVAHCLGAPVPRTTVISRGVAPFTFGIATATGEHWMRTCPPQPDPGKFTTTLGWRDPFALLQREDPKGTLISSIISQHAVKAEFSGATVPGSGSSSRVEGVAGKGDLFMLGRRPPEALPSYVNDDVQGLASRLRGDLGDIRLEWAHDGDQAWILQVHIAEPNTRADVLSLGNPSRWLEFDPEDGLETLREMVIYAQKTDAGIKVIRPVGLTSHVGEILRASSVPGRIAVGPD